MEKIKEDIAELYSEYSEKPKDECIIILKLEKIS